MVDTKPKVVYEIIYKNTNTNVDYMTTLEYNNIEECKKHFSLYTEDIYKVIGILKTTTISEFIPADGIIHEK